MGAITLFIIVLLIAGAVSYFNKRDLGKPGDVITPIPTPNITQTLPNPTPSIYIIYKTPLPTNKPKPTPSINCNFGKGKLKNK